MDDLFGEQDPRNMPSYFFGDCRHIDYSTALKADVSRQNYTVCPRHWYVEVSYLCTRCDNGFLFSAAEQKVWYEDYGFYVDSMPRCCPSCRSDLRNSRKLRQEYDRHVAMVLEGHDRDAKVHLADVIDRLCELNTDLPKQIHHNRGRLANQLAKG